MSKIRVLTTIFILVIMLSSSATAKVTGNNTYSGPLITEYYPINGSGHNQNNLDWGSSVSRLGRLVPPEYSDNISSPSLSDLPNPRHISNTLCADPAGIGADPYDIPDERGLSDFIWVFSQFSTHDLVFTGNQRGMHQYPSEGGQHKFDILIPEGDEIMTSGYYIPMFRSQYDLESGTDDSNPREQLNQITSWLDASLVYGSDNYRGDWLRTFENGLLKTTMTSEGPIPPELDPTNDSHPGMSFEGFGGGNLVVGDVRGNEHISLLALHTLFLREHNRLAVEIFSENPSWNDEQIYQSARLRVAGILQAITYNEFLPALGITLSEYEEYDSSIDPTILNAFTHSAFRMGHSQIGSWTMRLNENRTESVEGHIRLNEGFFDTRPLTNGGGIDPVLRGLAYQVEPKLDLIYSDDLRNQMFGQPNAGGMDLCAIDINRARDHGMPDYNTIREALGLEKITNWSQITSDSEVANKLLSLYPEPGYSDMFIGMLAEDHLENSSVGISVHELIKLQYEILRDSDHLFYLNNPEVEQIRDDIHNTTMADIILRNTMIEKIQCNVFFAEQNMDNMECIMNNEDKGFDPWVALEENDEDTILDDIAPNLVPPVKDTPGFVFSTTLVSLLGAVVYISKRKENN